MSAMPNVPSFHVEHTAKPPQRAESARSKVPQIGERDRRDIIRHVLFAAINGVPGEISAYVAGRMAGRFSERTIDLVIVRELLIRDRQVAASKTHAAGALQMLRELERDTRAELEGAA